MAYVTCADGFKVSIVAGSGLYSDPREFFAPKYLAVELGFPTQEMPSLMEWCEDPGKPLDTVYAYVPTDKVNAMLATRGGIVKVDTGGYRLPAGITVAEGVAVPLEGWNEEY